jgi:hypothetical protein
MIVATKAAQQPGLLVRKLSARGDLYWNEGCFEIPLIPVQILPPGEVFSNEGPRLLSSSRGNDHVVNTSVEI